jgi:hypothetical protein
LLAKGLSDVAFVLGLVQFIITAWGLLNTSNRLAGLLIAVVVFGVAGVKSWKVVKAMLGHDADDHR